MIEAEEFLMNRSEKISLSVLAIVMATLVLLAFTFTAQQKVERSQNTSAYDRDYGRKNDNSLSKGYRWPEFTPSDTYAQWIGAFVGAIGTVVSFVGLILLYSTLRENRNAVRIAQDALSASREIGIAQTRAYVGPPAVYATLEVKNGSRWLNVRATVANSGQSPAISPKIRFFISMRNTLVCGAQRICERDIPAGELEFEIARNGAPLTQDILVAIDTGNLFAAGFIEYQTVFGGVALTTFNLRLEGDVTSDGPLGVRHRNADEENIRT